MRLEFGMLQRNEYGTYFLRIRKAGGEGYAHRCSARVVSKELNLDHDTIWNIKPYPREYTIQDYADLALFTVREDPHEFGMPRKGTYLTFYIAKAETGFETREIRLDKGELEKQLEIVLKSEEEAPSPYRQTIASMINQATQAESLGELGNPFRPFSSHFATRQGD